ncbi:NAD(P)/FAD-dependent oxidoreductase [Cytophagaceae bacterium ABcell3]|nr:NAD(P)/FAD-dependent oxidoreductase [Cytophagaceae bacterium ABcell3]
MSVSYTEETDVLVIGAGPAGSIAASILKNEGFEVKIVEKEEFPRFVIGESLLPRCMENLEYAGLLDAVDKAGFQKKFGAKFSHVRNGHITDFDFSTQFTKGWSWTWQVKRADFDTILAKEVEKKGVKVSYKSTVTKVSFIQNHASLTTIQKEDGTFYTIKAKFIVDASGYGRVLPRLLKLDEPSDFPVRAAFFSHIKDPNRPKGSDGNRILIIDYTDGVWLWVIPFSDGTTSVGVVGDPDIINRYEGDEINQFAQWIEAVPDLKGRFSPEDIVLGPKKITGYSAAVKKLYGDGFVLTGNSTEFLDPIFSSGVTLASESSAVAAKLIARQLKGEKPDWETEYSDYLKLGVDVFRAFVKRWYDGNLQKIFFTSESNIELKSQICSVLAGYVWDLNNPFVKKHDRAILALANVLGDLKK